MVPSTRRSFLGTLTTVVALLAPGCVSTRSIRDTEQPIEGSIRISTGDLTPDRPLGTENPDYNLEIRNARDGPVSGTLSIGPVTDGSATREFDLPVGERNGFAVLFPQTGRHTVFVTLVDGIEESFEWEVNNPDPDEILSIVVDEGGIEFTRTSA